jgi:hypothetical protein
MVMLVIRDKGCWFKPCLAMTEKINWKKGLKIINHITFIMLAFCFRTLILCCSNFFRSNLLLVFELFLFEIFLIKLTFTVRTFHVIRFLCLSQTIYPRTYIVLTFGIRTFHVQTIPFRSFPIRTYHFPPVYVITVQSVILKWNPKFRFAHPITFFPRVCSIKRGSLVSVPRCSKLVIQV